MKGRSTGISFEIHGDELEHNRVQLERNLQNTELSFHISSASDDENDDGAHSSSRGRRRPQKHYPDSSVEYPRHLSEPSMPDFPSFAHHHRSRDFGDEEHNSQMHAWSYRTGDDEDGISPYGGETMSTAAHHASVVTISAGLGGGRTARNREPSLSGAEYDPDRPLHAMIAGVNSKHSMLDLDASKSKNPVMNSMTYDPVVVDSTAELDRLLESGHAPHPPSMHPSHSVRLASSPITSGTSSASDSEGGGGGQHASPRPKLTDHLRHVSFSPKRPRSVQAHPAIPSSPLAARSSRHLPDDVLNGSMGLNTATPRPAARRTNIMPSYASSATTPAPSHPEVRLHPATPSTTGSQFTRMARGINKELEATQQHLASSRQSAAASVSRPMSAPIERNPFHETSYNEPEPLHTKNSFRAPTPRKASMRDTTRSRIHLPDVTGLTNAVESPMKPGTQYYPYKADNRPRDSEARLLQTLSTVQTQLHDLEEENSISRRRVRELELDLEECKRQVVRERTKIIEREDLDASYSNRGAAGGSKSKGKSKARDADLDDERLHARYKEIVEEKKGLEALINSLRSHLTRLTSELASHQDLLTQLRNLREQDARALREKGNEINTLKEEVQRLAGEVEVLRGVVEEGVNNRRASREISHLETSEADVGMSQDLQENEEEHEPEQDDEEVDQEHTYDSSLDLEEQSEEEAEPFDPVSFSQGAAADKTMRTDHATLGSSNLAESTNTPPRLGLVDADELDRIAAEVEERRSNRSNGSIASQRRIRRRPSSPSPVRHKPQSRRATVEDESVVSMRQPEPSTSRPSAPTPGHAARVYQHNDDGEQQQPEAETPFPRIRGEQLEKLFFSAPEHNAKTCTVCYRRRHNKSHGAPQPHQRDEVGQDSDEGYGGSEGADDRHLAPAAEDKGKGRQYISFSEDPGHWHKAGRKHGLPPQTVVARVVRELEDDFTHYKSIYVELADQYKVMDAASDVRRRNMLAKHLREVVDNLEQKGDKIASLYDLLSVKDKPHPAGFR